MSDISQNDNFNLEQPRRGVTHAAQLTPHQRRRSAGVGLAEAARVATS